MQVKLTNGQVAEIAAEEAKRIHHALEVEMKHERGYTDEDESEHNATYHERAWRNIVKAANSIGVTHLKPEESDMKDLLSLVIADDDICSDLKAELIWEMTEWSISHHWSMIHNAE
jgi:hypothetical protein